MALTHFRFSNMTITMSRVVFGRQISKNKKYLIICDLHIVAVIIIVNTCCTSDQNLKKNYHF